MSDERPLNSEEREKLIALIDALILISTSPPKEFKKIWRSASIATQSSIINTMLRPQEVKVATAKDKESARVVIGSIEKSRADLFLSAPSYGERWSHPLVEKQRVALSTASSRKKVKAAQKTDDENAHLKNFYFKLPLNHFSKFVSVVIESSLDNGSSAFISWFNRRMNGDAFWKEVAPVYVELFRHAFGNKANDVMDLCDQHPKMKNLARQAVQLGITNNRPEIAAKLAPRLDQKDHYALFQSAIGASNAQAAYTLMHKMSKKQIEKGFRFAFEHGRCSCLEFLKNKMPILDVEKYFLDALRKDQYGLAAVFAPKNHWDVLYDPKNNIKETTIREFIGSQEEKLSVDDVPYILQKLHLWPKAINWKIVKAYQEQQMLLAQIEKSTQLAKTSTRKSKM